jgi:hypothetical protein
MEDNIKGNMTMTKNMDMVFTDGLMVDYTRVIGTRENSMDWVLTKSLKMMNYNMGCGRKVRE